MALVPHDTLISATPEGGPDVGGARCFRGSAHQLPADGCKWRSRRWTLVTNWSQIR
jgi:hypothetical protein